MDHIGVIVIGRNEGERLRRCLASVTGVASRVVYVDSASTDGSVAMARGMGVEVVELDMSIPFSAARARNAGYARLLEIEPAVRFVQFVDGDCEINADWLHFAAAELQKPPGVAIVAGKLHERFPDVSVYNGLGELEWNHSPAGEVDSVGGIFMIRREAFESVGGFDPTVTAGEEPELCQRLARRNWKMIRVDRPMAWHDLAMTRFGQWWKRQTRTGYSGMDVAVRFGLPFFVKNNWKVRFWTVAWPIAIVSAALVGGLIAGWKIGVLIAMLIAAIWPAQVLRIALRARRRGYPGRLAMAYGWFTMIAWWPMMVGQVRYYADRAGRRAPRLIEYKTPITPIKQPSAAEPTADVSTR